MVNRMVGGYWQNRWNCASLRGKALHRGEKSGDEFRERGFNAALPGAVARENLKGLGEERRVVGKGYAKQSVSCYKPMNTIVMFRRVLSVLVLVPVLAMAQAPRTPTQADKSGGASAPVKPGDDSDRYDIVIEDGVLFRTPGHSPSGNATLTEVVKRLREIHPEANIVLSPDLRDAPVGDIKLHANNLGQELDALEVASANTFTWSFPQGAQAGPETLYRIMPTEPKPAATSARVEVFNLTGYLTRLCRLHMDQLGDDESFEKFKMEQAKTAQSVVNQTIADMGGGAGPLTYEFHAGANLLIVMGSMDSLGVAQTVLNGLIQPPPLDPDAVSKQQREAQIYDLDHKISVLQQDNDRLNALVRDLKEQLVLGSKPTH